MSLGIRVEKDFNLGKIKLDLHKELNLSADIIISDIQTGINNGRDINGSKFKKLAPSTVQAKRAKGSKTPRIALSDTGTMKRCYVPPGKKATVNKQRVEIIAPKKRTQIGAFHQSGTKPYKITPKKAKVLFPLFDSRGNKFGAKVVNHPGLPKREWFGISEKAEDKAMNMISSRIDEEIRNA